MEKFKGISEFVSVVETCRFSAAARQLGVSKAYVSQRINQLEDRLGARLLQRTTRKQSLTDAGIIYPHGRNWRAALNQFAIMFEDRLPIL